MAVGFSGVAADVSISGTVSSGLAQPSTAQTPVHYTGNITTATDTTIATVGATKKIFITDIIYYNNSGAGGNGLTLKESANHRLWNYLDTLGANGNGGSIIMHLKTPLEFGSSETITLTTSAARSMNYSLVGFEVNA